MASTDLPLDNSAQPIVLVGATSAGVPTTPAAVTVNQNMLTQDCINTSLASGALSVTTTASEAKAGAVRLVNRKALQITPTNGTVYYGSSAAVTVLTGTPIFKNQCYALSVTDNVPIYLIAASTVDVRIVEGS